MKRPATLCDSCDNGVGEFQFSGGKSGTKFVSVPVCLFDKHNYPYATHCDEYTPVPVEEEEEEA